MVSSVLGCDRFLWRNRFIRHWDKLYLFIFFTAEGEGKLHVQEFYSSVSPPTSAFIVKDSPSLVVGVCVYKNCYSKSSFSSSKNLVGVRGGVDIFERAPTVEHDSYSLPEVRTGKLNFFAPTIYASLTSRKHSFKVE